MLNYILRRLLLIVPTLIGIMLINFIIVQVAPGGPVERMIAQVKGKNIDATSRISGAESEGLKQQPSPQTSGKSGNASSTSQNYLGAQGLDPEIIQEIEKRFGFDQPMHVRFFKMLKSYATFDFGTSFFQDRKVVDLVVEKMPVSISLGVWTTLLVYLISIPLGIRKAVRDGSHFDIWTSVVITIGYAIPGFMFAVLLIVFFAGGNYLQIFPLSGLVSSDWASLSWPMRIIDYLWHMVLPITAMVIGGFASLTMLTKNSFLDELSKQYVLTARAKGVSEKKILYGHVFRNAMLIVIAGFPSAFISVLFTGALLIEIIFSLDGLGLLGYQAVIDRDYPIMFATLYLFTLLGLLLNLIGDLMYVAVDPRIDFEKRGN